MKRSDRLYELLQIMRDGGVHTGAGLADQLGVSVRTLYRDMDALQASGVPIKGNRGLGYRVTDAIALPPLTLTQHELEALNLGIAIVSEAADPELARAAMSLGDKVDAALPERGIAEADAWKSAIHPLANAARGLGYMSTIRATIRARQKLHVSYRGSDGIPSMSIVRPLKMENWGRIWTLAAWCETSAAFREFRLDLIDTAAPLDALFTDEPGKSLTDLEKSTR